MFLCMFKGTTQFQSKLKLIVEMPMLAWSDDIANPGHARYYQLSLIYVFLDLTQAKPLSLYCSGYKRKVNSYVLTIEIHFTHL